MTISAMLTSFTRFGIISNALNTLYFSLFLDVLALVLGLLLYPLTIGSFVLFHQLMTNQDCSPVELFGMYMNPSLLGKSFKLYWAVFVKCFKYGALCVGALILAMIIVQLLGGGILSLLLYFFFILVASLFLGGMMVMVSMGEVTSMIHIHHRDIHYGYTIDDFITSLKGYMGEMITFELSFMGWSFVASLLAIPTLGLSVLMLMIYRNITLLFLTKSYDEDLHIT